MIVKNKNNNILNKWEDTEINRKRLKKWGLETYTGETETGYDGNLYICETAPLAPVPNYKELRATAYPPISEQLDMLYWDKVNNTNKWQETLSEVKNQFPKS